MNINSVLFFLVRATVIGLAAAFLVLILWPELMHPEAVVKVREQPVPAPSAFEDKQQSMGHVSYAAAVKKAAPAVVNIHTAKIVVERHPFANDPIFGRLFGDRYSRERKRLKTSLGSGVIISPQGYVLTNHHVVAGADEIQVMLSDGQNASATIVGVDPDSDLAVLHIQLKDLPSMVIGDSDNIEVGDVMLAIGNPFGVGQTVTQGIVSATGRNKIGINTFENFIQTDAAINPGNSGGALINAYGELIGINSAIFSQSGGSQGIGFAIPVNQAKDVMTQIIEHGTVVRGWVGIEAQELTPTLAESFGAGSTQGVLIAGVWRDGPADIAGLEPGDVITAIAEEPVTDSRTAMDLITKQKPGSSVLVNGIRSGTKFQFEVNIVQRPKQSR